MKHCFPLAATLALTAAAAIVFVSCGGGAASEGQAVAANGTIRIDMIDNAFRPDRLSVEAGSTVTFELRNRGKLPHNMHIASARGVYRESPWVSEPALIEGGKSGELVWQVPGETGTYKFRCDYHEVEMVGVVTVR